MKCFAQTADWLFKVKGVLLSLAMLTITQLSKDWTCALIVTTLKMVTLIVPILVALMKVVVVL